MQALAAAIKEVAAHDPNHRIVQITSDNIVEHSHPLNKQFVETYNYLLRHHQPLMKYYYDLLHLLKPSESNAAYALVKKYLCRWLSEQAPSVVVSAHPMTNHYIARAMKDIGIKDHIKLVTVVTDPNADLWRSWACPETDLFIVPNEIVFSKLTQWGMAPERIEVVGMPVHPDFLKEPAVDRATFLSHLGLSVDALTVCVNAGWAGGGNMLRVLSALRETERHIQVIFLCGHNNKLYEEAVELTADLPFAISVLPFHDRMPDLMKACDLMVTKAGGLTTYQAVASRLPLAIDCITPPMPQERGTVDILVDGGLAQRVQDPRDIINIVQYACVITDRQRALPAVHNLNSADAIYAMARLILKNSRIAIKSFEPSERATTSLQPITGNADLL